jgi:pyruvate dehydrogenase E1 component
MMFYKEAKNGQLLQEGINEAGALASWTAAASAYSIHGVPMLAVYTYYSMFGFQRVGDLIWAAADQRARGFLIGATAGKTTLSGEGLQHQDGTSQLIAATVPNCRSYDPAYAYELAVIVDYGSRRMMEEQIDEFYYITVMNENYAMPTMPEGVEEGILKGMYQLESRGEDQNNVRVRLVGSGTILQEVIAAADILHTEFGIGVDIFSATSFAELARDADETARQKRLNPGQSALDSHVETLLKGNLPVIVATDYVRAVPSMIAPYVKGPFVALGTDGFGRSDQREHLRDFFEVSRYHIVLAAIESLTQQGLVAATTHADAIKHFERHDY